MVNEFFGWYGFYMIQDSGDTGSTSYPVANYNPPGRKNKAVGMGGLIFKSAVKQELSGASLDNSYSALHSSSTVIENEGRCTHDSQEILRAGEIEIEHRK